MRLIALIRSVWSNVVRRRDVERDLDAELRAYVDLLAAEYERSGLTPDIARRRALVETGGIETVKDAVRDAWAGNALATISREMRYALRTLRRAPAFLGVAVGTLAIRHRRRDRRVHRHQGLASPPAALTARRASRLEPAEVLRSD
jgi:macrolide transport system ATP-binding/permease protein